MNGLLISYLDFSPIIVTLGGFAGARGMADTITHDVTQFGFGDTFARARQRHGCRHPGPGRDLPRPLPVGAYIWYEMPLGRHMTSIGADKTSARALGVIGRVDPVRPLRLLGAAARWAA